MEKKKKRNEKNRKQKIIFNIHDPIGPRVKSSPTTSLEYIQDPTTTPMYSVDGNNVKLQALLLSISSSRLITAHRSRFVTTRPINFYYQGLDFAEHSLPCQHPPTTS